MANWLERARREIPKSADQGTANTAIRPISAVTAVPKSDESGFSRVSCDDGDSAAAAHRQRAELQALIDTLVEKTGYFTEADKLEALEVALRAPDEWLEYLPLLIERYGAMLH